jgi:hypothetical protein
VSNKSDQVRGLKSEITAIREANRHYLEKQRHSSQEEDEHKGREERLVQIMNELVGLSNEKLSRT